MIYKLKLFFRNLIDAVNVCGLQELPTFFKNYKIIKSDISQRIKHLQKYKLENPGESYEKYLEINYWVFVTLLRFYELGLHNSKKSQKILDIGTGNGYFPFICEYFGHTAESIDLGIIELYDLVIVALEVKRYNERIEAFKDLEIKGKYDLITSYMVCFNGHKTDNLWDIKEWSYFIASLMQYNLLENGRIFLLLNEEYNSEEPISKTLLNYFSNIGALVVNYKIEIQSSIYLKTKISQ
jgi:hypothetical protein